MTQGKIVYTKTDEAPALATQSFLPIIEAYTKTAGLEVELKDISLAGRILSQFPDRLTKEQQIEDHLQWLGQLAKKAEANIIKLPNISASVSQLKACIAELQEQGFNIPDYPETPAGPEEEQIKKQYSKVLGSAVNPVLREGNSDRRVAQAVKEFAKKNPHRLGEWSKDSKTHVAHMSEGDFYGSEKSHIMQSEDTVKIVLEKENGEAEVLKEGLALLDQEIIDSAVMSKKSLCAFFDKEIKEAKEQGILLSLHLKATMMKVSDPIIFGHGLKTFLSPVFEKFAAELDSVGVNPNVGLGDLYNKVEKLPNDKKEQVLSEISQCFENGPSLAMVDSDKGITNLHVPSDVIIDASMPAMIKTSGKMWAKDGKAYDTKALIPDRSYAGIYQETISFCKEHGAFDVTKMGNVSNVGLMAKKAEEYGSHDKTFEIKSAGTVKVLASDGSCLLEHKVEEGDIWRMCQTKDIAIKDWVKLGVTRARLTGNPAVFWLDKNRAHDANLISKVETYLKDLDTTGLELKILSPVEASRYTLARVKEGVDTISVTGNVLRDYLTDLYPILELGTSAKMLSIVPLLAGGGLFETGAGGSAPKHVQQLVEENHLRWDSLGEFLALAVSLEDLGEKNNDQKIKVLAKTLNSANTEFLMNNKSPSRKVKELDNRGSHYYLALYWAKALSEQNEEETLKEAFTKVYSELSSNEDKIVSELTECQGVKVDLKGYYNPSVEVLAKVMRPSSTLNSIIDSI